MNESPLDDLSEFEEKSVKNAYLQSVLEWWELHSTKYIMITVGISLITCVPALFKLPFKGGVILLVIWIILVLLLNLFYGLGWLLEGGTYQLFGIKFPYWLRISTWILGTLLSASLLSLIGIVIIWLTFVETQL